MTFDCCIEDAKIYFGGKLVEGGIVIDNGKIVKIIKDVALIQADHKINAKKNLILPGCIDVHAHLRDFKLSYKEDFYTGTCSAAKGGITTVLDMPNSQPPTINVNILKERKKAAKKKTVINIGFYAAIPSNIDEISLLVREGIFGFKLYLHHPLTEINVESDEELTKYFSEIAKWNTILAIHPDDKKTIEKKLSLLKREKLSPLDIFLKTYTPEGEKKAVERCLRIIEKTRTLLHACHVSNSAALHAIQNAKERSLNVTCEVTPHHLLLKTSDLKHWGAFAKTLPPLRTQQDIEALWEGLKKGIIDVIATDHAPHAVEEKEKGFLEAPPGVPGFETMLPLMLTMVKYEKMRLDALVALTSHNPAKIFGLRNKGEIAEGFDADLVLIDMKKEYLIKPELFSSKAKYSPFSGWKAKAKVVATIVNGIAVMEDDEILVPAGSGKILERGAFS